MSKITSTVAVAVVWMLASAVRAGAYDLAEKRVSLHGYFDNSTLVRTSNFDNTPALIGQKSTVNLEGTFTLLERRLDTVVKAFVMLRPYYDGVYDLNGNDFGGGIKIGSGVEDDFVIVESAFVPGEPVKRIGSAQFPLEVPIDISRKVTPERGLQCTDCNRPQNMLAFGQLSTFDEYPLREGYVDVKLGSLFVRTGKQQVVWGKTDFFLLQDIVNPIDFGRHSFVESYADIRIPQWILNAVYTLGDIGPLSDLSFEFVWNFDDFQPVGLGEAGEPWANVFGEETKAFVRVHNLFGIGLRGQKIPAYNVGNTEIGFRIEWLIGRWRFALTDYDGFQDVPVAKLVNDFTLPDNPNPVLIGTGLEHIGGEIEFIYPRRNTLGLSADYYDGFTDSVYRIESAWTMKEKITNTSKPNWLDDSQVLRWSLGIDKQTFFRFLNPMRTFFLSAQVFNTWVIDHRGTSQTGMITDPYVITTTAFAQTWYWQDRLIPLIYVAFLPNADARAGGLWLEYLITNNWSVRGGVNAFAGSAKRHDTAQFCGLVAPGPDGTVNCRQENFFGFAHEGFGADRNKDEFFFQWRFRF